VVIALAENVLGELNNAGDLLPATEEKNVSHGQTLSG
jgi:hypothetical protein